MKKVLSIQHVKVNNKDLTPFASRGDNRCEKIVSGSFCSYYVSHAVFSTDGDTCFFYLGENYLS